MRTVTFYTKPQCPLCDTALETIERVRSSVPFELEKVDVSSDRQLAARYGELLPVVEIDGVKVFEYHVIESELVARLEVSPATQAEQPQPTDHLGANR